MTTRGHREGVPGLKQRGPGLKQCGLTLLDVLVSLIIISIGLLGIAKIHALAYSSTSTAGTRSLVALQAAGLAASMHGNRTFWAANTTPITVSDLQITTPAAMEATATPGLCETA